LAAVEQHQLIEGTILRHGQGRHLIYLDLAPRVTLVVPRADWKKYFEGKPHTWVGRHVVARGWVTPSKDKLRLRVAHPAMLTWPR